MGYPVQNMKQKAIVLCVATILVLSTIIGTVFAADSKTIKVSVDSDGNGSLTIIPSNPTPESRVDIDILPAAGYEIDTAVITDANGNTVELCSDGSGLYFIAPKTDAVISATFRLKSAELPFTDVPSTAWYYTDVQYIYARGITNGNGKGQYLPSQMVTRAGLVTMLWRMAGKPAAVRECEFSDVPSNSYYVDAVSWAVEEHIVQGVGNNQFAPYNPITREQLATMLSRYAALIADSIGIQEGILDEFRDSVLISEFAKSAVGWACSENIIRGSEGMLRPKGNSTRAEVAAILHRFALIYIQ